MPKTLLIVDDSQLSIVMLKRIAETHYPDWQVLIAKNGDEALEVVESAAFDVATLDYNMPGMNGIELGSILKGRFPSARIGLLTANIQDAIQQRAREHGLEFIGKPITEEKILNFLAH